MQGLAANNATKTPINERARAIFQTKISNWTGAQFVK
jgi:hypothetical protein